MEYRFQDELIFYDGERLDLGGLKEVVIFVVSFF